MIKIILLSLFLFGCGGGKGWTQCQPCDMNECEEGLIVDTPVMSK